MNAWPFVKFVNIFPHQTFHHNSKYCSYEVPITDSINIHSAVSQYACTRTTLAVGIVN